MKYLVLTIRKPEFDAEFIPAHYAFLDELRADRSLEQAGPFTDRSGGAYVLQAENLDQARSIAERDPLHISNSSTVTVHEWNSQ
ncbi:MAG: YciI family protein [Sphingomicrobium sp.]